MSEQRFTCVLGNDYHIINNNVDDMTYFLQDGNDVVLVINLLNKLYEENERLKNKLNVTALELVDEAISMGKAVEISEMSYREFIDYRTENGKPMELQL